MTPRLRLGLAGAGNIGLRHLALARESASCEVVAVADPGPGVADALGGEPVQVYASSQRMLDEERLDGVIVAVPNDLHAEVGIACVRRGVPILMEKPITDTSQAAVALLGEAARAGVPVCVGHHRRFDPTIEIARRELLGGAIGRLAGVECLWSLRKHPEYYAPAWRRERPAGGPVLINLIHDLDLLRHLCGDVVRVHAEGASEMRGHAVEDTAAIVLRFAGGALGTVLVCDAAPSPWGWEQGTGENPEVPASGHDTYRFLGTEGALTLPGLALWRHADGAHGHWHRPLRKHTLESGPRAALAAQLEHFCAVVRGDEAPRVSGEDGFATLRTALAVLESMRTGEPRRIDA